MQLPPIGGVRKVLKTQTGQSGTTIAEFGNNTITLEQLAAAILNLLTNTNSIVTGQQNAGVLVPGPGLAGGGVLTGNVPIRLTAPISPYSLEDGSVDNDAGMVIPGPPGPRGIAGPSGQFMIPEDGADGDWLPGPQGVMGSQGPQGVPGTSGTGSGGGMTIYLTEDATDNDAGYLVPGPIGPQGATGATGATGASGLGSGTAIGYYPYSMEDGGVDNDAGYFVPGPAGATGATGSAGTGSGTSGLQIWIPDDIQTDEEIYRGPTNGPVNGIGVANVIYGSMLLVSNGATNPGAGGLTSLGLGDLRNYIANNGGIYIMTSYANGVSILGSTATIGTRYANFSQNGTILGPPNSGQTALTLLNNTGGLAGNGIVISAGRNNVDYNFLSQGYGGTAANQYMAIYGDGSVTIGTGAVNVLIGEGQGTLNVAKGYYLNNVPLSASLHAPGMQFVADDTSNDDGFTMMGQPTAVGPTQINGYFSVYGPAGSGPALFLYPASIQGNLVAGVSNGLSVQAGYTATDSVIYIANAINNAGFLSIFGDGHGSLGTGMTWTTQGAYTLSTVVGFPGTLGATLTVNGGTLHTGIAMVVQAGLTSGTSNGLYVFAGGNASDTAFEVLNAANTAIFMQILGTGIVNLPSGSLGVKGVTPSVTAGQTDIGVTTTATVITTAGGIALPTLASTFWVVNVNGVKYGIPCFAL